jgi:hypothetical protein
MPRMVQEDHKTVACIDVEMFDENVVWSVAIVQCTFPQGVVISMKEFFIDRSDMEIKDARKAEFWKRNQAAYDYHVLKSKGCKEADVMPEIANYIDSMRKAYPFFYGISSNMELDLGIVNFILKQQNRNILSNRQDKYVQMVCAWTYQVALCTTLGTKGGPALFGHPHVCHMFGIPIGTEYTTQRPVELSVTKCNKLQHTPLNDCLFTLTNYFKCLDINKILAEKLAATPSDFFAPGFKHLAPPLPLPIMHHYPCFQPPVRYTSDYNIQHRQSPPRAANFE